MVEIEANEKDLKVAEVELKAETVEIEKEKADTRTRTAEDEQQASELEGRREGLRTGIAPDLLRHYDSVIKLRKTALAEARDHKCSACQLMLRPQVYNDVRTNQKIVICDSCQRILYYLPEEAPAEPAAANHQPASAAR